MMWVVDSSPEIKNNRFFQEYLQYQGEVYYVLTVLWEGER